MGYLQQGGQTIGGQTPVTHSAKSQIQINPFSASVRLNSTGGSGGSYSICGQSFTHPFAQVFVHEARHAYQYSQAALQGNDQDSDWLIRNAATVAASNAAGGAAIFQDTATQRNVCNEFTMVNGALGATFSVAYKGDSTPDPFPSGPGIPNLAGDTSPYVDYALEMDAHMFTSNYN